MELSPQADQLVQKIKELLLISSGHTLEQATIEEFYQALCLSLREEIMAHCSASMETIRKQKPRILNYLSMEYLPGRRLYHNLTNLHAMELIESVLKKVDRNFDDLLRCENDPGLGNGGLGRLASCFLDSLATLHYPARAYGLRYQYGIFEQEIHNGVQVEKPDCWLLTEDPWEMRRDQFAESVFFSGHLLHGKNKHGEDVYNLKDPEEVRALPYDMPIVGYCANSLPKIGYPYSVVLLRLWSTKESPRNFALQRFNAGFLAQASENTALTDVLYPNDNHELGKRMRLKQEFLLVSASLQDILRGHLQIYGDLALIGEKMRIQINDTHPALVIAELVRMLIQRHDFSWEQAWETCQSCCSYTNHSVLKEALEEWNETRIADLLPRQYKIIQQINQQFCNEIRSRYPEEEEKVRRMSIIEEGQIRMAHLAVYGSHRVNGVAKIHTEILRNQVFTDFAEMMPDKFVNVTNGVSHRRWLLEANPVLSSFITQRIGSEWITQFKEIEKLKAFASDPASQKEFLSIKRTNKERLLHFLSRESFLRDAEGKVFAHPHSFSTSALFSVQIKRFHEYKRQLLSALHLILLFQEENKRPVKRLFLFAGKAAPGYEKAKQILRLIQALSRTFHATPSLREQFCITFVENYNVSRAQILIPGADLSEQISTAGWEASGTGNMKLAMNGALTIGTQDGANIEMQEALTEQWWPFSFGKTAEENRLFYHPRDIYSRHPPIAKALEALKKGTFAENGEEIEAFSSLAQDLYEKDFFRVLQDLPSYYETQQKVEALFLQENLWAETAIHQIAAMGRFSSDESIKTYAEKIWGLSPCPPNPAFYEKSAPS